MNTPDPSSLAPQNTSISLCHNSLHYHGKWLRTYLIAGQCIAMHLFISSMDRIDYLLKYSLLFKCKTLNFPLSFNPEKEFNKITSSRLSFKNFC